MGCFNGLESFIIPSIIRDKGDGVCLWQLVQGMDFLVEFFELVLVTLGIDKELRGVVISKKVDDPFVARYFAGVGPDEPAPDPLTAAKNVAAD